MGPFKQCTPTTNHNRRKRILLGVTGSVAAIKCPELALQLSKDLDAHVVVLLTQGGENFWCKAKDYNPPVWDEYCKWSKSSRSRIEHGNEQFLREKMDDEDSLSSPPGLPDDNAVSSVALFSAKDEWKGWQRMNDPVLHIQLRDWADIAVVAPLSAHTLAKIATGLCDETLSCVLRAWDFGHTIRKGKPILLAPAMNTAMWEHPLTASQLSIVKSFGHTNGDGSCLVNIVDPVVKTLACGEVGTGAMASTASIVKLTKTLLFTESLAPNSSGDQDSNNR